MIKFSIRAIAALVITFGFIRCSDEEKSASLQVVLIDAPADYDAVFIEILDVQVNTSSGDNGWQSLTDAQPGTYDLLKLVNGEEALMGNIELPGGNLSQIRLILGDNNKLVQGEAEYALTIPSGSESGLKVNIGTTLENGISYKLVLDFDVAKSVVMSGTSGKYNLKPVIRGVMEAQSGAIEGSITPIDTESIIYAIVGSDTITSSYPDETGQFLLRTLDAGTYNVVAVPTVESGFLTVTQENVTVNIGVVTTTEAIEFTN